MARTLEQKVGDWQRAYEAVRQELVPPELRTILATMKEIEGVMQLQSYTRLAGDVLAADRAAGAIAASLVQNIRGAAVDLGDDA